MVPGRDDLRVRMSVTLEEDTRLPTPLELECWEEVPDQVVIDGLRQIVREVNRVDEGESMEQWAGRMLKEAEAVSLLKRRHRQMRNFVKSAEEDEAEAEEAEEEFRWAVLEEEPDFEKGWNAYRRELLETVGMTMLPTWEKLPDQVRESWCYGVRTAMGKL
jgi:hypothetical protein